MRGNARRIAKHFDRRTSLTAPSSNLRERQGSLIESFDLRRESATRGRGTMLKITTIDTDTEQRLILEGRLANPSIADLSSHWTETRHAHPERDFVVDLTGAVRMDTPGERALGLMNGDG